MTLKHFCTMRLHLAILGKIQTTPDEVLPPSKSYTGATTVLRCGGNGGNTRL